MNLLPGDLWTRVEALFLEAVELPACARELFVLENCGGDVRVRDEVLALLVYCDEEPPEIVAALDADAASLMDWARVLRVWASAASVRSLTVAAPQGVSPGVLLGILAEPFA
jgi:hypothetical protein